MRIASMVVLLAGTALAGCGVLEPSDTMTACGPIGCSNRANVTDAERHFASSYTIAQKDQDMISSATARPGKPVSDEDITKCTEQPANCDYSPFDYQIYTTHDTKQIELRVKAATNAVTLAKTNLTVANAALASVKGKSPQIQSDIDAATTAVTAATSTLSTANAAVIAAKETQAETVEGAIKPGSSLQSTHARAMVKDGFAAADQHCYDFFVRKGTWQAGGGLLSDTLTKFGNMAAGAAGLAGAGVGLPSGFALGSSIFSNTNDVLNKDFLFGDDNINTTWMLVKTMLASDTAANLPESDTSDWNFGSAAQKIRDHQDLCRTPAILARIKSSVASPSVATVNAVNANGSTSGTTATSGAGAPGGAPGKNINPQTGAKRPASATTLTVTGAAAKLAQ